MVADFAPDVVINAAAYTAVDQAESDEQAALPRQWKARLPRYRS